MIESPTFEATFPDGERIGTLKIGNETISVYIAEASANTEDDWRGIERIENSVYEKILRETTAKRKFVLIEE